MTASELISKAETQVRGLFVANDNPALIYHTIFHTEHVVANAEQIAANYSLRKRDHAAVIVSTWFHDTGYLFTTRIKHEEKSAELAASFLEEQGEPELISKVKECILATQFPQQPSSLLSQIACDADLFHLGTPEFQDINKRIRKEKEKLTGESISRKKWRKQTLAFLEGISFHTEYAKNLLDFGKEQNIIRIKEKIGKNEKEKVAPRSRPKETKQNQGSVRGVETMFRTTSGNHLQLSEMADTKANILMTVNSIIASILISILFRKLEEDERFLIPALLFLLTSLASIILAILVTRPNVTQGTFTKEDIEKKRANLLFFGNFHNMSLVDYQEGIDTMMKDSEFLYGSMTRDIYYLGKVLARKYRLLRIAYNFFMIGFIASVSSFVIAVTMFHK